MTSKFVCDLFHPVQPLLLACALGLLACTGCASMPIQGQGPQLPALSPGPLRRPTDLAHDFQWRQRVTAIYPAGKSSFDAVLLRRNNSLTLVGLSPIGMPGFVITTEANGRIHMENRTRRTLPFRPTYIAADVQHAFFPWFKTPLPGFHGTRSKGVIGLTVSEDFEHGTLVTRRLRRNDAPDRGEVIIQYGPWPKGADVPKRVTINNTWFNYKLVIETLEQTRL